MCVVCGCSDNSQAHARHAQGSESQGGHDHGLHGEARVVTVDPAHGDLHFGTGAARVSVPGISQARAIKLETDILGANNRVAAQNRAHFAAHGVTALNLVSSPGSGKTTLLCATIDALSVHAPGLAVAVIEGDQQTSFDADRIRATGAPAIQINTGKGCHLDAPMVAAAFAQLHVHAHAHDHSHSHSHSHSHAHEGHESASVGINESEQTNHTNKAVNLLFIENVGNLVCPAVWDLGEAAKVAILSVTEGEDKPLKYPDMFAAASLMVLNKIDLLPHVRFDVARCIELARRVNPTIAVLQLSATTGEGMRAWLHWLEHQMDHQAGRTHHHHSDGHAPTVKPATPTSTSIEQALRQRVRELEAALALAQKRVMDKGAATDERAGLGAGAQAAVAAPLATPAPH